MFLVDGHQWFYRAWFGLPVRITSTNRSRALTGIFPYQMPDPVAPTPRHARLPVGTFVRGRLIWLAAAPATSTQAVIPLPIVGTIVVESLALNTAIDVPLTLRRIHRIPAWNATGDQPGLIPAP